MSSALQLPWESLRAFAEGAFDGIAIIDEAGRIREWNSQACELFGWRRNEVLDRPIDELIAPQSDRDAFRESFTQIQREDRLSQTGTLFQVVGQHKSGSRLMVGISIVPICTEPGRLYAAYIRDVSQDSPLVPQLRPETTTIQLLYQTTMVSATALSYEEALGRSIERICELTGWTIGHAWLPDSSGEILKSSDIWRASDDTPMDVVREAVRDLRLQRGEGFPGQIWERRKPCWIADISTDPTFSQAAHLAKLNVWGAFGFPVFVHDQLVAVLEFFSPKGVAPSPHLLLLLNTLSKQLGDIFERRRWDEERRRLATIVESSQDAIISKTPEGIIASWNQGAEEMYGYRVEDAVGKPVSLILPNDLAQEEPEIRDVVKNGRPLRQFETVRRRKNGRLIDVSITISPIRDANGNIGGTASIERDITRRTRHEHELMEAKQQAEIANRMKSEFLANISHELRTPMNAIIGMVDLSLASPDVPQIVRDNLATARESADVLLMLLNDLLDFSRLDVGRFEIECEPFPLRRTIDEAMHILALRAEEKGLALSCHLEPQVPNNLKGDGRRLKQIVMNLVGNAIKFTDEGEVDVRVRPVSRHDGQVVLELSVRDTGDGIEEKDQQRIFEPFTQTDATMTRQHGGVGLGLAICRELVDKMRGSISVKSTVGEGSTFTCRIPFAVLSEGKKRKRARPHDGKKDLTKPARPSPKTWKDSSRLSVLVAEDTRANQQVIRAILKQRGHQVTLVENGKAALDKLQKSDFDVIVMDIQMPVMDGLEATRSIRAMPDAGKSHVPIVAITAHAMKQDRDKCLAAGMNAYLPKPIDAQELLEVIEETYREGSEAAEQDTPAEGIPPPCSDFSKRSGETEAQEPSEPIMDLGATRKRLRGNEKLLKDLIDYFLQDSPGLFEEFGQALEAGDAERAARTAHTLKGLASNFDAHRAVAIAKEIENLVRAGNLDKAAARNEEFTRRFEELTQALKETS